MERGRVLIFDWAVTYIINNRGDVGCQSIVQSEAFVLTIHSANKMELLFPINPFHWFQFRAALILRLKSNDDVISDEHNYYLSKAEYITFKLDWKYSIPVAKWSALPTTNPSYPVSIPAEGKGYFFG